MPLFPEDNVRPNHKYTADVVLQQIIPTKLRVDLANYWWRYELIFECYWGDAYQKQGDPIFEPDMILQIKQELNQYLRLAIQIFSTSFDIYYLSHGILGVSWEDPTTADEPFGLNFATKAPTPSPVSSRDNFNVPTFSPTPEAIIIGNEKATYRSPIDAQFWVRTSS